jgi:hypothetical protein
MTSSNSAAGHVTFNALGEPFVFLGDPQQLSAHRGAGHLIRRASDELRPCSVLAYKVWDASFEVVHVSDFIQNSLTNP